MELQHYYVQLEGHYSLSEQQLKAQWHQRALKYQFLISEPQGRKTSGCTCIHTHTHTHTHTHMHTHTQPRPSALMIIGLRCKVLNIPLCLFERQDLTALFSDNTGSETINILSPSGHKGIQAGSQFSSPASLSPKRSHTNKP